MWWDAAGSSERMSIDAPGCLYRCSDRHQVLSVYGSLLYPAVCLSVRPCAYHIASSFSQKTVSPTIAFLPWILCVFCLTFRGKFQLDIYHAPIQAWAISYHVSSVYFRLHIVYRQGLVAWKNGLRLGLGLLSRCVIHYNNADGDVWSRWQVGSIVGRLLSIILAKHSWKLTHTVALGWQTMDLSLRLQPGE